MQAKNCRHPRRRFHSMGSAIALLGFMSAALVLLCATDAAAIELRLGQWQGSLDNTVSLGFSQRVSDRDQSIIGTENGGTAYSVNGDDGNLNYDQYDWVSATFKVTHELQLGYDSWSIFGRAYYFHDFKTMDWGVQRTDFTAAAKNEIGEEIKLLDLYVARDFSLGDRMLTVRAGNQVLNWGESLFIQNGINSMSPIDVSKLRVAGSELRDALEAIPMAQATLELSDRFSLEGFLPFKWDHTEIEASGSFFSTNDFASPGGRRVLLGFGQAGISDTVPNTGVGAPVGVDVPRAADIDSRDGGEYGIALRWFEPKLNDSELGFYFTHLHSRLPLISGWTGLLQEGLGTGNYASTANYFREFPGDIDTYGFSLNTELPRLGFLAGMALQGEVSLRHNQPLQVDDVELLFAALSPLDQFIGFGGADQGFKLSQLAGGTSLGFDEKIVGYRRKDVIQAQATVTKLIGPSLGADQWVFLSEIGAQWVKDMEDPSVLRYEGPGTYTSANPWFTENVSPSSGNPLQPGTETNGFADDFAWGYRAVLRADLNNFIGSVTLQPALVWYHDVSGTSPSPVLNFIDGRKSVTGALTATYLISWSAKLTYTNSFGGDRYNLLNDRDFVSMTLAYSF